jgi:nucleoside-diphosphate-sugar epimerase
VLRFLSMKVLLVGGSSSLASVFLPTLSPFADVLTAGRSNCDLKLDLRWDVERFEIPPGIDCVVNLAANFGGHDFESMLSAEETNAVGVLKLADTCRKAGVSHFIQISSIFTELNENSQLFNSYALSKRHAEELLNLYHQNTGYSTLVLRPSRIYGEGETFRRHQPFLYALLDKAEANQNIVLNGNNDAIRNFIYCKDVAEIVSLAIQARLEGVFQCAAIANLRMSQIAAAAIAACGSSSKILFNRLEVDIPDNPLEVNVELFHLLRYFPQVSLVDGLAREVARRRDTV